MAYFGKVPFSHHESCEGQARDQRFSSVFHSGSAGEVPLGFDRIVDEVNNEFHFYGSSHSHHEDTFFPSDVFGLHVPDHQICGQPLAAYSELRPGNPPVSDWQQSTMSPTVGFRPSLLYGHRNFSLTLPSPYSHEGESYRGNANVLDSGVQRGHTSLSFQLGFDTVDAQHPVSLDSSPFGQEVRCGGGKEEDCVPATSKRWDIGPTWPSSSGLNSEVFQFSHTNGA